MRLLLDTHTLIWHYEAKPKLSPAAIAAINDERNSLIISAATAWEMVIKVNLKKLVLGTSVSELLAWYREIGAEFLPITERHAIAVGTLPEAHRDPFDRVLAAQAITEKLVLVTRDPAFEPYPVQRLW